MTCFNHTMFETGRLKNVVIFIQTIFVLHFQKTNKKIQNLCIKYVFQIVVLTYCPLMPCTTTTLITEAQPGILRPQVGDLYNCCHVIQHRCLQGRSSRSQMFFKIGFLKNFAKFTGKHLCQSLFFRFWHKYIAKPGTFPQSQSSIFTTCTTCNKI